MLRLLSGSRPGVTKLLAGALGLLLLGTGSGLAVAAAGGLSIPQLGVNVRVPADKAAALERLASVATTDSNTQPAPAPSVPAAPIPARLLGPDTPAPVSPSLLHVRNGWLVSDGRALVAVYAGAAGGDPSRGRIVIVRQNLVAGKQTVRILDARRGTGALTIASAPLGRSVETSAQTASLRLRAADGRPFALGLGGKVSLTPYKAPLR